jgi:hypothetical protein
MHFMKNLWIVITTINKPTQAIVDYAKIVKRMGWKLLIVGDAKTPKDYELFDCEFLSHDAQQKNWGEFSRLVPLNHYCRKNIGYLHAFLKGAEWVFDTDDDNIPLDGFAESLIEKRVAQIVVREGFVNVYKHFSDQRLWPRGIPLQDIHQTGTVIGQTKERSFGLTQFLADRDPDVDAIYRLTNNEPVIFNSSAAPVYLPPGTWSPFNSQATLVHRNYFHSLYLPCHVPFRMTDIWRSFVAQKMLWAEGEGVAFVRPNVVQQRNPHDFFKDFKDEVLGYLHNHEIRVRLDAISLKGVSPGNQLLACYSEMKTVGVVEDREFALIEKWNALAGRLLA